MRSGEQAQELLAIQHEGCHDARGYPAGPRSDRDKVIAGSALSVGYGREVGMIMLIYIMAFAYAAVSPIILPFTLCFFTSCWVGSCTTEFMAGRATQTDLL